MNVPNYAQVDRITRDMGALLRGEDPDYWKGNSYQGIPSTLGVRSGGFVGGMRYKHWYTTIAVVSREGKLVYFDATYRSTTTRGFQSRILQGLRNLPDQSRVQAAYAELAKPTDTRDALNWSDEDNLWF